MYYVFNFYENRCNDWGRKCAKIGVWELDKRIFYFSSTSAFRLMPRWNLLFLAKEFSKVVTIDGKAEWSYLPSFAKLVCKFSQKLHSRFHLRFHISLAGATLALLETVLPHPATISCFLVCIWVVNISTTCSLTVLSRWVILSFDLVLSFLVEVELVRAINLLFLFTIFLGIISFLVHLVEWEHLTRK